MWVLTTYILQSLTHFTSFQLPLAIVHNCISPGQCRHLTLTSLPILDLLIFQFQFKWYFFHWSPSFYSQSSIIFLPLLLFSKVPCIKFYIVIHYIYYAYLLIQQTFISCPLSITLSKLLPNASLQTLEYPSLGSQPGRICSLHAFYRVKALWCFNLGPVHFWKYKPT